MMQVSLYLNNKLSERVNAAARSRNISVSKFISEALEKKLNCEYSPKFLGALGTLAGVDFERPAQPDFADDSERSVL